MDVQHPEFKDGARAGREGEVDQTDGRSDEESSLPSSAPTSMPSGRPCRRFGSDTSSATLLLPQQWLVCCIDRLNPPPPVAGRDSVVNRTEADKRFARPLVPNSRSGRMQRSWVTGPTTLPAENSAQAGESRQPPGSPLQTPCCCAHLRSDEISSTPNLLVQYSSSLDASFAALSDATRRGMIDEASPRFRIRVAGHRSMTGG